MEKELEKKIVLLRGGVLQRIPRKIRGSVRD